MERLLCLLGSIHPLSPALLQFLTLHVKEKSFLKKEFLLKSGHISRHIYFIESGLMRCFYRRGDSEVSSWFMKEGDLIVSIESFFLQQPSYEAIQALEDSVLYYIDYSELQAIYKEFPEFNFIGRVLTEKYYILWARQLYGLRMQQAPERYQWLLENHPDLILRVPAKYLSSWLGITEVMLSKIKGKNYFL